MGAGQSLLSPPYFSMAQSLDDDRRGWISVSSHVFGLFPPVGPEALLPVLVIHVHFLLASPPHPTPMATALPCVPLP